MECLIAVCMRIECIGGFAAHAAPTATAGLHDHGQRPCRAWLGTTNFGVDYCWVDPAFCFAYRCATIEQTISWIWW